MVGVGSEVGGGGVDSGAGAGAGAIAGTGLEEVSPAFLSTITTSWSSSIMAFSGTEVDSSTDLCRLCRDAGRSSVAKLEEKRRACRRTGVMMNSETKEVIAGQRQRRASFHLAETVMRVGLVGW